MDREFMNRDKYKDIRKQLGTQATVAEKLDVRRETVACRESGRTTISVEAGLAILQLLAQDRAKNKKGSK